MNILLTNDDGAHSEGLAHLIAELKKEGTVIVVVPDRERSAISHSITLSAPIRMKKISKNFYAIDGTPSDCVNVVLLGALKTKVDLIVSGINKGPNMSEDIIYSGTVAAAIEGAIANIPSFAISIDATNNAKKIHYATAAIFARRLITALKKYGLKERTLLNVNVPNLPYDKIKGIEVTKLGSRVYYDKLIIRKDPHGNPYFWIKAKRLSWRNEKGTDYYTVKHKKISITPLHIDLTCYSLLDEIQKWRLMF